MSVTDYSGLASGSSAAYDLSSLTGAAATDLAGITGYVFELFDSDVSLTIDPSFAASIAALSGLGAVDAVAYMTAPASDFNSFIQITVDSSDIDDLSANDAKYGINSSFVNPFDVSFSNAEVKYGQINTAYADQIVAKDIVRHVAKSITGGYAVADIFTNETAMKNDVHNRDADFTTDLSATLSAIVTEGPLSPDGFAGSDYTTFYSAAQSLFIINSNDATRRLDLFADLSNNSSNGSATNTANLRFYTGDAIALKINYDPASSPVTGMGSNTISSRSYRVLIELT